MIKRFYDKEVDLHLFIEHDCGPDGEEREYVEDIDDGYHNIGRVDITPYDDIKPHVIEKLNENVVGKRISINKIMKNNGEF